MPEVPLMLILKLLKLGGISLDGVLEEG